MFYKIYFENELDNYACIATEGHMLYLIIMQKQKKLDILFGRSNYERDSVKINLTENSFLLEISEPLLAG